MNTCNSLYCFPSAQVLGKIELSGAGSASSKSSTSVSSGPGNGLLWENYYALIFSIATRPKTMSLSLDSYHKRNNFKFDFNFETVQFKHSIFDLSSAESNVYYHFKRDTAVIDAFNVVEEKEDTNKKLRSSYCLKDNTKEDGKA